MNQRSSYDSRNSDMDDREFGRTPDLNHLIPRGLASGATAANVARIEHEKRVAEVKSTKAKAEAGALSEKLSAVKITIERPVGEGDRLYGSVTTRDIEEALAAQGFA